MFKGIVTGQCVFGQRICAGFKIEPSAAAFHVRDLPQTGCDSRNFETGARLVRASELFVMASGSLIAQLPR